MLAINYSIGNPYCPISAYSPNTFDAAQERDRIQIALLRNQAKEAFAKLEEETARLQEEVAREEERLSGIARQQIMAHINTTAPL